MSAERLRAMLSEATRGPWFAREDDCAVETQDLRALVLMDDRADPDDRATAMATARLIAIAPDAIALLADMGETLTALRAQVGITKHADGDTSSMVIGAHSFDAAGVTEILQRLDAVCGDDRA